MFFIEIFSIKIISIAIFIDKPDFAVALNKNSGQDPCLHIQPEGRYMNRNRSILKKTAVAALLGTAFCSPAAFAEIIDFEDTTRVALTGGETAVSGIYAFKAADGPLAQAVGVSGAAGAVYNGSLGCGDTPCPSGNAGNFYAGLNDGAVSMTNLHHSQFSVSSLDFGFLAPVFNVADGIYGQLRLTGYLTGGGMINTAMNFAGQDGFGKFMFQNWTLDQAFSSASLSSLEISACLFDNSGACNNSLDALAFNQAQFTIDNLNATDLPEPAMPAMLMLGALGMALAARRRAK